MTEGSADAVGVGDALDDADADSGGEPTWSAAAKGLAATLSAIATKAALDAFLIRPNGEQE